MSERILIVDDDPVQRRLLDNIVRKFGYEPLLAEGGDAAAMLLTGTDAPRIDAVVLDLVMPDLDGLGVLAKMREAGLTVPVIVQTAHGGIDNVVSAMRAGATDFVVKPVGIERLAVSLRNALAASALKGELARIKRSQSGTLGFKDIITSSPRMHAVLRTAQKAATSAIPVLIEGQSGVGKELVARAIHGSGERRSKPFIAVNCGAIPDNLVESILFGHEKGAFTGSTNEKPGAFEMADGGTIFLDEVAEMPTDIQVKLLRSIETRSIRRLGGKKEITVDIRILAATNRDLQKALEDNDLREDLYYRLAVVELFLPPLRERMGDIKLLANEFLARFAQQNGKQVTGFEDAAWEWILSYNWPGNVRELKNAVERAVIMGRDDKVRAADIMPRHLRRGSETSSTITLPPGATLADTRRQLVLRAFASTNGDYTRTANIVGMSPEDVRAEITSLLNGNGRPVKAAAVKAPSRSVSPPAKSKAKKR
jgi:DNA-binding NtrC family response regulator